MAKTKAVKFIFNFRPPRPRKVGELSVYDCDGVRYLVASGNKRKFLKSESSLQRTHIATEVIRGECIVKHRWAGKMDFGRF